VVFQTEQEEWTAENQSIVIHALKKAKSNLTLKHKN